jgi:hypothetical protein
MTMTSSATSPAPRLVSVCAEPAPAKHPDMNSEARRLIRLVTAEDERRAADYADPAPVFTIDGHLVPPLKEYGVGSRIRLSRHCATKKWRACADALDAATDAVASALNPPTNVAQINPQRILADAVIQWRNAAARALCIGPRNYHQLRQQVALAAIISGARFAHGGLHTPDGPAEWAFGALDIAVCRIAWDADRKRQH